MQPYSRDIKEENVYKIITLICCALGGIAFLFFKDVAASFNVAFVSWPLIYKTFNKYGWNNKLVKKIFYMPDVNGDWTGYIESSYDNFQKRYRINVTIIQTWKKINLLLDDGKLTSELIFAKMEIKHNERLKFHWVYHCKPKPRYNGDFKEHDGTAYLYLEPNHSDLIIEKMDGGYYTNEVYPDHPTQRFGRLFLERKNVQKS